MTSDESDDEPLSVLAAYKKSNPDKFPDPLVISEDLVKKKKKKPSRRVLTDGVISKVTPVVVERPTDVWMYLKDLKPVGPYSCLLCPEWFINRAKLIMHYVLNHEKDFCGICRYLVTDRFAYWSHMNFHTPWPCSQCIENFPTQVSLRNHLSSVHKLVHCRLCHFLLPDNDQHYTHLFQKHNFSDVSNREAEEPWELESDTSSTFHCLLCSKSDIPNNTFYNHYMGFHHYTLKCLTNVISGKPLPFTVKGVDISAEFIHNLRSQPGFGYIDFESGPMDPNNKERNEFLKVLLPEIKQEDVSDSDNVKSNKSGVKRDNEILKYEGEHDFDVTLMELIVVKKSFLNYVMNILNDINLKVMPKTSNIEFEKCTEDESKQNVNCQICNTDIETGKKFLAHMFKMHCVKAVPDFWCRVCATTFDSLTEMENHIKDELGDFEDLWLCQFCDKEFDNRELTREHLIDHWDIIENDNCFSPHLGFKCRYCPTLFWNETDREVHQTRIHFNYHKDNYYKCDSCSEVFSDKVWFIYHFLIKHQNEENDALYLYKCCLCCIVYKNVDTMRNHFNDCHPEARKIYCCLDPCKYRPLSHKKSFKLHLRTIHGGETRSVRVVRCQICALEFTSARACSTHVTQSHGRGKFKCSLCKECLYTSDERKLHYLIRHPGQNPFICRDCGKSFLYKSSLYMHRQEHIPNKKKFTCPHCSKVFTKKDSFREHVQIHEAPRHACSYCPMRFVQRSNMLRHERRHTGERPYACPICGRTFADKGACTSHTRTHSKERAFVCVYCSRTFLQKSKLTYHIRKHTGENLETCTVCSKLFTSGCSLREHMKIHNPKTVFVDCPLCDKKYSDERYMLRHLRTVHAKMQYSCPLCPRSVTSASGLRQHVLTHSALDTFRCKCCVKTAGCKRTMLKHLRRRHGLSPKEINIKDYYHRLDPRECELDLDEDMFTNIFGPPQRSETTGDYITYTNTLTVPNNVKSKSNQGELEVQSADEDSDDNDDDENDSDLDGQNEDDNEMEECGKLEPTDFVSVKMEPIDDEESQ